MASKEASERDLDETVSALLLAVQSVLPFRKESKRGMRTPDFDGLLRDRLKEHLRSGT